MQTEIEKSEASEDRLLTETEVVSEFGLSLRALRRWRHEDGGGPPVTAIGRLRRYRRGAVRAWIRAQEAVPGPADPSAPEAA